MKAEPSRQILHKLFTKLELVFFYYKSRLPYYVQVHPARSWSYRRKEERTFSDFHSDQQHSPMSVVYDVLQSSHSGWSVIGQWSSGVTTSGKQLNMADGSKSIRPANRMRITVVVGSQYVYYNDNETSDTSKLQGFCIDVLKELSKQTGIDYEIHVVKDGKYGSLNKTTGQWNGMIGEVHRGEADIAVGSITLTSQRAEAVDFLPPFRRLELKFLVKRTFKTNQKYDAFSFFHPFNSTWYYAIFISVFSLTLYLAFISAFSPYGIRGNFVQSVRQDRAKDIIKRIKSAQEVPDLTNSERQLLSERSQAKQGMGLNNALYLMWAGLFSQSPERVPQSISGKIIAVTWFFAATVFVSSYTAKVVTSVSLYDQEYDNIRTPEDLLLQNNVPFGMLSGTAVMHQLEVTDSKIARQMYKTIVNENNPQGYHPANRSHALELVKAGKFAWISDSIGLENYAVKSNCELKTVSVGFGSILYAFPIRKGYPFRKLLSDAMLELDANGFLDATFWKHFSQLADCDYLDFIKPRSRQLTFTDLAGVFYVMTIGLGTSMVVLVCEWLSAAFADINAIKRERPKFLKDALKIRWRRLLIHARVHLFPLRRIMQRWEKVEVPRQTQAEVILESQLHKNSLTRRSELRTARSDVDNAATLLSERKQDI